MLNISWGEISSEFQIWANGLDVFKQLVGVLADEGLGVVAGNIMPLYTVIINIIKKTHASLNRAINVKLCIVRLGNILAFKLCFVACIRPGLVAPAWRSGVGGSHLHSGPRPEPSIYSGGLEIFPVTTLEVAQAACAPNIRKVVVYKEFFYKLIFGGSFKRDQVHAILATNISAVQPVHFVISEVFLVSREPVVMTAMFKMFRSFCTFFWIWEG